ncbi:MAG: hypothetical protein QOE03_182 [Micromonosporaceae bacterium]|nr:hypothetical protein [Micromonosporaceae bacterium]
MSTGEVAQTSAYLRMLLLRPGDYRSRWERHAERADPGLLDLTAIARVLGERGAIARMPGERADGATDLTPTVRGALDGTALDPEVLRLFVEAFTLDGRDAARLRELLRGTDSVRVITGEAQALSEESLHTGPPRHETLALHELHVLGPDGSPAEHQTIQVIRSVVDGLGDYPYRFDTDELAVEVIRGGRVGDRIYRLSESLYAVDILLATPLAAGETTLTQVRTTFFYKTPPAPEFRRGIVRATDDVTIWVKFHPGRVPARLWLARWDGIDHARIVDRQRVELDDDLAAHSRFGPIEQAVVGFYWEWT